MLYACYQSVANSRFAHEFHNQIEPLSYNDFGLGQ